MIVQKMILNPHPVSFSRWRRLSKGNDSLLRSLEHEYIEGIKLSGLVLDVGGGRDFRYLEIMQNKGTVHSVNIAKSVQPTVVADLNELLPLRDASYDHVISFNTLEHIREDRQLLAEIIRVLRPQGSFLITVPFLYRIHGSPFDFHRHTAIWWEQTFIDLGIPKQRLNVEPLLWSPFSTACANCQWFRGGFWGNTIKRIVLFIEVVRQAVLRQDCKADKYANFALGYVVSGTKL